MPFDYLFNPEHRLLTIIGDGVTSLQERFECVHRIMHDKTIDRECNILIDDCQVLNTPLPAEIRSIGSLIEVLQSEFKGRVAILNSRVGHTTITQLIAYNVECGPNRVQAFMSENEAREWLHAGTPKGGRK